MDKLIERLSEIGELIDEHKQSIFLLEDEKEMIETELSELQDRQRKSEDIAWRQMKL